MGDKVNLPARLKRKKFAEHFTNEKNEKTFLNSTQSALLVSNSSTPESAAVTGHRMLMDVKVQQDIMRRISTKEQDQEGLTRLGERIEQALSRTDLNPDNALFFKALSSEYHKNTELKGKFRNDFEQRSVNVNINANVSAKESKNLNTDDLINALTRR